MSSLIIIQYEPFFDDPWKIRKLQSYYFESTTRSRKLGGFNLFVMHKFFYVRYLRHLEKCRNVSIISISSTDTDDEETAIVPGLTMKEIARQWNLLTHVVQKAWNFQAAKLNKRAAVGKIARLPSNLQKLNVDRLLCMSLQNDWCRFRVALKKYLVCRRRRQFVKRFFISSIKRSLKGKNCFI